ncbi:MAG TPA: prepilin peptidase [Thermoleophilaceae bacterium]
MAAVIVAAPAGLLAGWAATAVAWRLPRGRPLPPPLVYCTMAAAAAAFVLVVTVIGDHPAELARDLILVAFLVPIALIDAEYRIIPNRLTLAAALTAVALFPLDAGFVGEQLAAAAGAFGFYLVFALLRPNALGMGDVKLAGVLGLYLGAAVVVALLVASLLSLLIALVVAVRRGRAAAREPRPFGPALAAGALVAMLAGAELVDWWVQGG